MAGLVQTYTLFSLPNNAAGFKPFVTPTASGGEDRAGGICFVLLPLLEIPSSISPPNFPAAHPDGNRRDSKVAIHLSSYRVCLIHYANPQHMKAKQMGRDIL